MKSAFFPGKFDPIHNGQVEIARRAAALFDELIVAVSDFHIYSSVFPLAERVEMVRCAFSDVPNIRVIGYNRVTVVECVAQGAHVIVGGLGVFNDFEREFRLSQLRHHLDPKVEVMALISSSEHNFLSSSVVRTIASRGGDVSEMVPPHVVEALRTRFED